MPRVEPLSAAEGKKSECSTFGMKSTDLVYEVKNSKLLFGFLLPIRQNNMFCFEKTCS